MKIFGVLERSASQSRRIMTWFERWFSRRRLDSELSEEIREHLEQKVGELVARGMRREEAEHAARREFGNVTLVEEDGRSVWRWPSLESFFMDVRYALRMLRQNPGFTAAAVLALALGIGINVGVFSVLNGVALRSLPIPHAEQVFAVNQIFHGHFRRDVHGEGSMFSYPEYLEYRDSNHVFSGLVAYEPFVDATLAGGNVQQLSGALTSCNYFDVLNEHPAKGRGFVDSDCAVFGANAVVVVSDDLWRGVFAGDPALVGNRIILNHSAYTVIGIAPVGFGGTEPVASAFWAPFTMQEALNPERERLTNENMSWLAVLGRVRPDVTMDQVRADLGVIAGRLDQRHPGRSTSLSVGTATFFGTPEERQAVFSVAAAILTAFGLVLLIACANVANLLLARASVRHKEIALRLSIGAGRWRLVRQLLTESLLLSLIGGAGGSLVAFWSFSSITHFVTTHLPRRLPSPVVNVAPDLRVFIYALALSLVTGIAFGLIPALQSSRLDLNTALKEDGSRSGRGKKSGGFLRSTLVGTQIAVCMILLVAAGLLLRGLYHAHRIDPGFDTKDIAVVFLNMREQGYAPNHATHFVRRLRERIASLPGVVEVAQAECAPLSHDFSTDQFSLPGWAEKVGIEYNHVSPEYFSVVGIPIVRGRGFGARETHDSPGIIVTESTARRLWPGQDPLAKTLRESSGREYSVVGVAKDAQVSHLGELGTAYLYFPAGPEDDSRSYILTRFAGVTSSAIARDVREAAQSLDPEALVEVTPLEDYLEIWRTPSRIVTLLSGALGALALLLASIGVYGTVSYSVSRCVREIGIRMALGADRREIVNLVLRRAMRPVLIGGLIGVIGCAAVSAVLSSLLFGLSAHDPIAFIAVPILLLFVALAASYIPARRAMRVDPIVALRYE